MKLKQKLYVLVALVVSVFVAAVVVESRAFAEGSCGGVDTAILNCSQDGTSGELEDSGFWGILLMIVDILTVGVGVLATAGIVYAGILYSMSGDSPDQLKKAIEMIRNVVIGLLSYGLMYSLMNFLIPGGLFN